MTDHERTLLDLRRCLNRTKKLAKAPDISDRLRKEYAKAYDSVQQAFGSLLRAEYIEILDRRIRPCKL